MPRIFRQELAGPVARESLGTSTQGPAPDPICWTPAPHSNAQVPPSPKGFRSQRRKGRFPGLRCAGATRRADPVSPTAPLLNLRELSSGRDNPCVLFSRRIELFEIGDDIVNLLRIFQTRKSHFGTGYLGLGVLDVLAESFFIPGDSGILVRGRIAVAFNHPGLSPEQPVEHRADCVLCVLPNLVARLALDENLLARSRILGIPRNDCEDSGSEPENEPAHPTISMADKEYACANRSDYFANRLRTQNDSIALKDILAKPDHIVGRLVQRADDFPISCFRKRLQRARPDVSQHAKLQAETCRHSIVRSLVDRDDVIVAHGKEKEFELAAHIFEGFLCRVQTTWRVLHFQRALVGPICKHDVCGHDPPPSRARQYLRRWREK